MNNLQQNISLYNQGELPYSQMNSFIESLILELGSTPQLAPPIPTFGGLNYKDIFNQKETYNGHGQMEIPRMLLSEVFGLIEQLDSHAEETKDSMTDIFSVCLYAKEDGKHSGTIYQQTMNPTMWLSIEDVIIDA